MYKPARVPTTDNDPAKINPTPNLNSALAATNKLIHPSSPFTPRNNFTPKKLSAGGPVVDPQIESVLLTPICTHSLFSRSLIFKPDSDFVLRGDGDAEIGLSCDGEDAIPIGKDCSVRIKRAEMCGEFIRIKNETFLEILNSKLEQRRL